MWLVHQATGTAVASLRFISCGAPTQLGSKGADVNAREQFGKRMTPLHCTIECQHNTSAVVQALLDAGADVDAVDNDGDTTLSWMVLFGVHDCIRLLLAHGADPCLRNHAGETPVDIITKEVLNHATVAQMRENAYYAQVLQERVVEWRLLARAAAWRRRRHILLAIRCRSQ